MNSCKTTTTKRLLISQQQYQEIKDRISTDHFVVGLQYAQESITQSTYNEDVRIFQEEFTLPMKRNLLGLLSIPVYVNHVLCHFILDTGAQISGIRTKCAKKIGIHKADGELGVGSVGGSENVMPGCIAEQLQIGGLEYHQKPMIILNDDTMSLRFGNVDLLSFDGIIGWDILSKLDFEMDDIAKKFKVLKNKFRFPCQNIIPGSFPTFLCVDEKNKLRIFGFDSGSKVSWIAEELILEKNLNVIYEGHAMGFGVHGTEKLPIKIVDRLYLHLDRANIVLKDTMSGRCNLFDGFRYDGVLGNQIFKGRRIRIVNSKNVVLLV